MSYLFTDRSVTVNFSSKNGCVTKTFDVGTDEYKQVKVAIVEGKLDTIPAIVSSLETKVASSIAATKVSGSGLKLEGGVLYIDNCVVPPDLHKRIIAYAEAQLPYDSLVKFFRLLLKNPSYRAVQGLFRFLEANHFPLTSRGYFVGYKAVSNDFKDLRTGKFDNSVGKVVCVKRNEVDEDPSNECSHGLHLSAHEYAHNFGGQDTKVVEVEVNPADVVAVPYDYNSQKMRVCKYLVLGVSKGERKEMLADDYSDSKNEDELYEDDLYAN